MTRILRLLLIAAIALPLWQPAVAQNATGADPVMGEVSGALNTIFKVRKDAKPYEPIKPRGDVPNGYARVTLAVGIAWNDGYGYQLLLDQDATVYNTYNLGQYGSINDYTTNYDYWTGTYTFNLLTAGSTAANNVYNACEYKIPENADNAANTQNVINDQASILIPAGTYDYAITVPFNITRGNTTYNVIGFATDRGDTPGRGNDFEFESGKSYLFYVMSVSADGTSYDAVFQEISAPYMALLSGDGAFGDVEIGEAATATFTVMNTGEEPFTPVVNCDNPAFTISSTGSGLLASGSSRNYVVTFAPTEMESYNGTFSLTAAEGEAVHDIHLSTPLSGRGIGEGQQGDPSGGDSQNAMYPIYTNNAYYGTSSQMIYPASMLTAQGIKVGDVINSLTFYVQNNGTVNQNISRLNVTLRLGNTTATTVTSQNAMTTNRNNSTQVFNGTLTGGQNTLTVTLSTPYQYQGDNLIVDFVSERTSNNYSNFQTNWAGENGHTNASYCTYDNWRGNTTTSQGSFLPELSIGYSTMPDLEATTSLDFDTVSIGNGKALTAIVKNLGSADVQATLTVADNPPFSVANSTVTIGANSFAIIPVTFMPKAEGDYNGTLTVVAGGVTTTIPLKGTGVYTGPEATRDSTFFKDITYTWPIVASNGMAANSQSSKLNEIATDPDQIIAMLRAIYMNPDIPGNFKRGYSASGGEDHDDDVLYSGVGTIASSTATTSTDSYGWNIPGNVLTGTSGNTTYRYLDPNQYKPHEEGVTLLLIEMVDDFKKGTITASTHNYTQLREYIASSIRTARVVTESKRVGEGIERGTMFKIDCDKMNKFYLLAKGQLLWFDNQKAAIGNSNPVYYNNTYTDDGLDFSYLDGPALLCHMFEQFSPTQGGATAAQADLYRDLTQMKSFGVIHDCPNVPFVQNGHHFMMYGEESLSKDCQDVRDLMFFVPDYRMMEHFNRGSGGFSESRTQDYFRYYTKRQPTMGLFVIHQDEIPEIKEENIITSSTETMTGLCKHQLAWKSNLDDFLPGEYQYYELWEVVIDEFGMQKYVPVYERNEQGQYKLENGTWVSDTTGQSENLVPVILPRELLGIGADGFKYPNVYVDMTRGSQTKTYVIRGRDAEGFLSLQMSNPEDVFIPGLDPNEKARMIGATYYSRYNADNQKNCYSNKLELSNNGMTLTVDELSSGLNFYRSSRAAQVDENGNAVTNESGDIQYVDGTNKVLFATATATQGPNVTIDGESVPSGTITVTLVDGTQSPKGEYPVGQLEGVGAGYHANNVLTFNYIVVDDHIRFGNVVNGNVVYTNLYFWDNYTVDVSKNAHPLQYLYKMEVGESYSNDVRVPVFKTDSRINSYTLEQVNNDVEGDLELEKIQFGAKVQLASKTELLRYDAYRWKANETRYIVESVDENGDEEDFDPTGIAGNQGDTYTVTMNDVTDAANYYVAPAADQPTVSTAQPFNWATFVDYYPDNQPKAQDYIYAPVVELFTRGYKEGADSQENKVARDDYNTYGGPLQGTAVGKLEIAVVPGGIDDKVMTDYYWLGDDGNKYSYYSLNVELKRNDDSPIVPEGYQFYKVRAWRQVLDMTNNPAPEYLGEQFEQLNYRKGDAETGKYKFEEFTYPDGCNVDPTADAELNNIDGLGSEDDISIKDQSGNTLNFTIGTFGARRVKMQEGEQGTIDGFKVRYVVRIYFAPQDVVDAIPQPTQPAPSAIGPKAEGDQEVKNFYIVEAVKDYVIDSQIPTDIKVVNAANEVVGVKYYNVAGIESDRPFQGVNIVVTRYSDGPTTTTKIIK